VLSYIFRLETFAARFVIPVVVVVGLVFAIRGDWVSAGICALAVVFGVIHIVVAKAWLRSHV
jgi:hypothetical protein